jgi:ribosomal protein L17
VADYSVDIAVAVKGSQQLKKLRSEISNTSRELTTLNKLANKQSKTLPNSFLTLNKVLKQAKLNLDKAAIGTDRYYKSARQLVQVERQYNRELYQRRTLMNNLRGGSLLDVVRQNTSASQAARQASGSGFRDFSRKFQPNPAPVDKAALAIEKSIARHAKNTAKNTAKTAQLLTQQNTSFAFQNIGPGGVGGIGGRLNKLGFGKKADPTGMFAMKGGLGGRIKGGIGSALIGGGFPLLFGGGGASAAAGGAAGGLGGALAMGGGFAASIAATAIVAQVQEVRAFRKAVRKLDEEMEAMGVSSDFSRKRIKELAKELGITKEEAIGLVAQFKDLGEDIGNLLIDSFGDREIVNTLAGLRDSESVLEQILTLSKDISFETKNNLLQTLATEGPLKAQLELQKAIFNKKREAFANKQTDLFDFDDVFYKNKQKKGGYRPEFDTLAERMAYISKKTEEFAEQFTEANKESFAVIENMIKINEQMQFLSEFNAPADELRELMNPMRQVLDLSNAIRTGFEDSFKGIIRGTMSVSDAFRNMLNRIADHFLDTAARLAAAQIQKSFLGLFSNMFSFDTLSNDVFKGFNSKPLVELAEGGPARSGNSYIVGERGPELFTPGVSGTVTPNHALGGSTNIVVNVDASGSSVQGDEDSSRELGRLISVAVQSELIQQKRPGGLLA